MPYKKFVRESERDNEFEHAKIIAIVDRDGMIKGYDYTITREARDFFADPEDKKKYEAITVKPVACESMSELQEKFRVAEEYLCWGASLEGLQAHKSMKSIVWGRGSTEWIWHVNDNGMMGDVHMSPHTLKLHGCKPSPHAHGIEVKHEDLKVVNEDLKEAEYKVGDRIQLCLINRAKYDVDREGETTKTELPPRDFWVTIQAKRTKMWVHEEDHFFQDELVGMDGDDGDLIEFNPKHVIQHRPKRFKDMTPVEQAKWFTSGSNNSDSDSDGDSDSDDSVSDDGHLKIYRTTIYGRAIQGMTNPIPGILKKLDIVPRLVEKIKLERQSDADLPESAPKPEQSDAVAAKQACFAAEQAVAPLECIVPPRAPRAPRRRARPAQ